MLPRNAYTPLITLAQALEKIVQGLDSLFPCPP
jgi:hypothetical protein